jgi:nitrogen fixation NifU-like protein
MEPATLCDSIKVEQHEGAILNKLSASVIEGILSTSVERRQDVSWNPDEPKETVMADSAMIYSEAVIDHAMNPRNPGAIGNADGYARIIGSCGDTMEIWITVRNGIIVRSSFMTDGCVSSIASGSMVTEIAAGKRIDEARGISQQDVSKGLGGLPPGSEHCALLAADTLKAAIGDYFALLRQPWKKAYRRPGG